MAAQPTTEQYTIPRRGCAYEEEKVLCELFTAASWHDRFSPEFQHLFEYEVHEDLDAGEDECHGPLLISIPRKYLIAKNMAPPPSHGHTARHSSCWRHVG